MPWPRERQQIVYFQTDVFDSQPMQKGQLPEEA
jgi:hypothetical protein